MTFLAAKTLKFILHPRFLVKFKITWANNANNEPTKTRNICMTSLMPCVSLDSFGGTSMYDGPGTKSSWFSSLLRSRDSFKKSERRIRHFTSHATSESDTGRLIQSPVYLTSAHVRLLKPGCLGVENTSWSLKVDLDGDGDDGFLCFDAPKRLFTWVPRDSKIWRFLVASSPVMAWISDSARMISSWKESHIKHITRNWLQCKRRSLALPEVDYVLHSHRRWKISNHYSIFHVNKNHLHPSHIDNLPNPK